MITRRDYLGGMLAGVGTALLSGLTPHQLLARSRDLELPGIDSQQAAAFNGPAGLGDYARANGNTWEVMSRAHLIRDGNYNELARLAVDDGGNYDVVMVGGGPSSLGTSYRCTSSANLGPIGLIFKRHFSASCFSSLTC